MTRLFEAGLHPFYIGMYIHIYTHIYVHIYTSQKECLHIFSVTLILTKTPFLQEIFGFDQGTSSNYMDLAQNFRDLKSTRFCNKPPLDKDMNY